MSDSLTDGSYWLTPKEGTRRRDYPPFDYKWEKVAQDRDNEVRVGDFG